VIKLSASEIRDRACRLRVLAMDVDGVLTDGALAYLADGSELKAFHTFDGIGLMMARAMGIKLAFITGKDTPMVAKRAAELKIDEVIQGQFGKEEGIRILAEKLGVEPSEIAYVGDDLHDIPALKTVALPLTVSNARNEVKDHAVYVSTTPGGHGAMREIVEWLLELRGEKELGQRVFTSTEAEKAAQSDDLEVHFEAGADPLAAMRSAPATATLVWADLDAVAGYTTTRLQPLSAFQGAEFGNNAEALLEELNTLRDANNLRYSAAVVHQGYEPWWFHQERAAMVLRAYARFGPLLEQMTTARSVTVFDCPADLAMVISQYPGLESGVTFARKQRPSFAASLSARVGFATAAILKRTVSTLSVFGARLRRPKVMVFTSDVVSPGKRYDRRIESIYTALADAKVRYLEIVGAGAGMGGHVARNLLKRRRGAVYRMAAPLWGQLFTKRGSASLPAMTMPTDAPLEQRFLHQVAANLMLPAAAGSVRIIEDFRGVLRWARPQSVAFIDDARYVHEVVAACHLTGIAAIGVQHGIHACFAPSFMARGFAAERNHGFDRYLVWSPFFAERISSDSALFDRDQMHIVGEAAQRAPESADKARERSGDDLLRVLFIVETYDQLQQELDVFPYLRALGDDPRLQITVKLRPGLAEPPYRSFDASHPRMNVGAGPIDPFIRDADVVVGSWSSAILDAVYHRKPLVLFTTPQYDDPLRLSDQGIAVTAKTPDAIVDAVLRAVEVSPARLQEYRDTVWGTTETDTRGIMREEVLRSI
jgi:3-deoxy-D-manno-octulosonate 8-phosphate phosphatase (KDO 8-P phosphatase)